VLIGVVLPCVHEYHAVVGERGAFAANPKRAVGTAGLNQNVTVMMGVSDQWTIHVKERDAPETALEDLDCI
jgi:hypothetical protein